MRRFGSAKCKMLAEKLEAPQEFHQARDMGFVYFQGIFFLPARGRHRPRSSRQPLALFTAARNGLPLGNRHA